MPLNAASNLKILIAMGTRPEIIKQAPVVWAARRRPCVEAVVLHSGQHTDLAEPMLSYFNVQPDIQLDLMRSCDSLGSLVGGCLQAVDHLLAEQKIDVVIVQGDTATAAAVALAGFYRRLPVVHVEAGLRTGNLQAPWPEELNRRMATLAASLHCAPTSLARARLLEEGVATDAVLLSGNTIVDALNWTLEREGLVIPKQSANPAAQPLVVLTAHRRENFGKPLEDICAAVLELANRFPAHRFVFVTHPNPHAGPVVRSILNGQSRIEVAPPMSYPQFVGLMHSSCLIISDSGGIQEEAPSLGVPLLITRTSTERPEAVECGAAELVGTDRELLVARAADLLEARREPQWVVNPFGDGAAGERIIDAVVSRYSGANRA